MKKKLQQLLKNEKAINAIKDGLIAFGVLLSCLFSATSCNVTRTITTESSSLQKGDTSVVIQTKTIESYNAKKHL